MTLAFLIVENCDPGRGGAVSNFPHRDFRIAKGIHISG
jgi:hypothetical protein